MENMRAPLVPLVLGALSLLSGPVSATWSIVVVNTRTGEVGVASATCLESFNLRRFTPVIFVGAGAASAQGIVDTTGINRRLIRDGLRDGLSPEEILEQLAGADFGHENRVYGIASVSAPPATFLGASSGMARHALTGTQGDYLYAVQGSGLTDPLVILATEAAFVNEQGDMGKRLLAALQAGKRWGGDGRCSCAFTTPTACGAPPPVPFKSAHCGYIIVSRLGDTNGPCGSGGCAQGDYYLTLNIAGPNSAASAPDPVDQLQARYIRWRERQIGRPDGLLSGVSPVGTLPADGRSGKTVKIVLRDINGTSIENGGAQVEVRLESEREGFVQLSPVTDHGDGGYTFTVTAGRQPGNDRLIVTIDDTPGDEGSDVVTLAPYVPIELASIRMR